MIKIDKIDDALFQDSKVELSWQKQHGCMKKRTRLLTITPIWRWLTITVDIVSIFSWIKSWNKEF